MKIESVRIENFRSYADVTVSLNDYTCLVGPNGVGKSTVLTALNVFFRETESAQTSLSQLCKEDFHCRNIEEPIHITITFTDLSEEAQQDFSDYFRQGKLIVSAFAAYNARTGIAEIKQYGQRLGMLDFAPFFKAESDGSRVADLKSIYAGLRASIPDLPPPGTKDAMKRALHDYESEHSELCESIQSEDQFYGFSKGSNLLSKHIQWVYVPAVKDPASEQVEARNSALGKLLSRTVRSKMNFDEIVGNLRGQVQEQYQTLLDNNQSILNDISTSLQSRLSEWAHPDTQLRLQWRQDPDKSVRVEEPWAHILIGENDFEGELARFGHGLQRSFLIALLQQLAETGTAGVPKLILACEEPELYQHPPQIRHLADILRKHSQINSQVIVSTHSPAFISGEGFEDVRMIHKRHGQPSSSVSYTTFEDVSRTISDADGQKPVKPEGTLAKIHQTLQLNLSEMFFTEKLILVEGLEDMAYLSAYFDLLGLSDDYRRIGCHIVPVQGKSQLLRPLVIARHLGISTYVVFDADADKEDKNGSRAKHEKDNSVILTLLGERDAKTMPDATLWGNRFTMWWSDIGAIVEEDIGKDDWEVFCQKANECYGRVKGLRKNVLNIGAALAFAWDKDKRSPNLERLCQEILNEDN